MRTNAAASAPITRDETAASASDPTPAGGEEERVRRRRRRRRSPMERNAFRFRAVLLVIVLGLILLTLMGDNLGRGAHRFFESLRASALLRSLVHNFRWETMILMVVAVGLILLMIPDAEDKILRFLRLRKDK